MKSMKKFLLLILLFIVLMPFVANAETCDLNKITIDSVTIKEKTDNVTEIEQPVIEGKKIKVNLKMKKVNDSIEYKMVVKNDSNEDFELDNNSFNVNSDYIEYNIKTDDDTLIVKAGKTKEIYLKIQYKNEVPDNVFTDGKFNDTKSFLLNISNDQTIEVPDTIKNPDTGDNFIFYFLIFILCICITIYMVLIKKKLNIYMSLLLVLMIMMPSSVHALCKMEIDIESNVTIEKSYEVGYLNLYEGWYTDEELANYQKTPSTECYLFYKGDEKFNVCSNIIIKDNKLYSPGETVNLRAINNRKYSDRYFDAEIHSLMQCEESSDGTRRCPSDVEELSDTIETWEYDNHWNQYGYIYDTTDKQIMNFNTYNYDSWDINGYFNVIAPQTFTMPNHSVLFVRPQETY